MQTSRGSSSLDGAEQRSVPLCSCRWKQLTHQTRPFRGEQLLEKVCLRLAKELAGNDCCLTFITATVSSFCLGAESARLITETRLLVERSSELQRRGEASSPGSSSRPFGQKMSHSLAVVWRVPNKALSQNVSESFHTGEEMTSRL